MASRLHDYVCLCSYTASDCVLNGYAVSHPGHVLDLTGCTRS